MKKKVFRSPASATESALQIMRQAHQDLTEESRKLISTIPIKYYIPFIHYKGWIYKKTSTFKALVSKSSLTSHASNYPECDSRVQAILGGIN